MRSVDVCVLMAGLLQLYSGYTDAAVYMDPDNINRMTEYVYFTEKLSWNTARNVCHTIGGDLAKIDSQETLDFILNVSKEIFGIDIYIEEYWVGMIEVVNNAKTWAYNCDPLNFTSNFPETYKDNEMCHRLLPNHDHIGERRNCMDPNAFLCRRLTNVPCKFKVTYGGHFTGFPAFEQTCRNSCLTTDTCMEWFFFPPSQCFITNTTAGPASLNEKFCLTVSENTTALNLDDNRLEYPAHDCTFNTITTSDSPQLTSSRMPSSTLLMPSSSSLAVMTSTMSFVSSPTTTIQLVTSSIHSCVISSMPLSTIVETVMSTVLTECSPSVQFVNVTFDQEEIYSLAEEIAKNLTVAKKSTMAYHRSLVSVEDPRTSSTAMGIAGIVCVVVPVVLMLVSDLSLIFIKFQNRVQIERNNREQTARRKSLQRITTNN